MDGFLDGPYAYHQSAAYRLSLSLVSLIVIRVLVKKAADFAYNLILLQIKFRIERLKNEESVPEDKAYVNITQNETLNSCHSAVGKMGSNQPLEISGCSALYMVLHEFVHALGILFYSMYVLPNINYDLKRI